MKISNKLTSGFLIITLLVGIAGYISVKASQDELRKHVGGSSVIFAAEILDKIDRSIYNRIEEFQVYSNDLVLQKAVVKSNQEFDQLYNIQAYIDEKDGEWISAPKDVLTSFMKELIADDLSEELIKKAEFYEEQYGYKVLGEVFITNRYGANIAQTGKTSDYRQDDEEWWQNAKKDGLYVGDIEYDKSADVYSVDICIGINGGAGNFLGAVKIVLNIEEIIDVLRDLELTVPDEKQNTHRHKLSGKATFKLLTQDGRIIYSTEEFELFQNIFNGTISHFGEFTSPGHVCYFVETGGSLTEEGGKLFAHAHSAGYRDFKGLGWILIVEQEKKEIFAPVVKLRNVLLIILFIAIILAVLIGFFISRSISESITKLRDAAVEIGKGKLNTKVEITSKDEIGDLGNCFNNMAEDLRFSIKKEKEFAAQAIAATEAEKKKSDELQRIQKNLEKHAAELSRSNNELEEFAYIASHDLQEPLRKVKTFGDRLIQKYGEVLGDQGRDYLKRMGNATNRMQTLINDLLAYSRVTSKAKPFVPVNLNDIVRDVLSDLEIKIKETNAQIHVDHLSTIAADPLQMRQLFQNLIGNALKFCKPEVPPVVEIRDALKSYLNGNDDEESLMDNDFRVITVVDNGIGFEEKYKEQIFRVFQRLHGRNEYAGTGIGLSICRKIVLRHGGGIEAESAPGKGSTFNITLPILQPKNDQGGEA